MISEYVIAEEVASRTDEQVPALTDFETLIEDVVAERVYLVELYAWQVNPE